MEIGDYVKITKDKLLKGYIGKIVDIHKDSTLVIESDDKRWGGFFTIDEVEKTTKKEADKLYNKKIKSY